MNYKFELAVAKRPDPSLYSTEVFKQILYKVSFGHFVTALLI